MNRQERSLQILDSALKVFVEKGYNGATTQEIAKRANISEVTLFRHFDSKKEIFMQGIEPILITTLEDSIVESKDLCPVEKLKYILINRINILTKHHKVIKLILMESQVNPDVANLNYIEKISDLFKETINNSGLKMKNPEFVLRILMGSILSYLYSPEMDNEKISGFVNDFLISIIIN